MKRIMELSTIHSHSFKILVEVLREVLQEATFTIYAPIKDEDDKKKKKKKEKDDKKNSNLKTRDELKKGGMIKISACDPSITIIVNVELYGGFFDPFICEQKKLEIGQNFQQLSILLRQLERDNILTLYVEEDKSNLCIEIKNPKNSKVCKLMSRRIEIEKNGMGSIEKAIPDLTCKGVITIPSAEFHKICKDLNSINRFITIICTSKMISFIARSDCSRAELTLNSGDKGVTIKNLSDDEIIQGRYDLNNIVMFTKCQGLCDKIQLYISEKRVLAINYSIGPMGSMKVIFCPSRDDEVVDEGDNYYKSKEIKLKKEHDDTEGDDELLVV